MAQPFDEMYAAPDTVREHYRSYAGWLAEQPGDLMQLRREEAELIFRRVGITFAVYGAKDEGCAGLLYVYRAGNVILSNAILLSLERGAALGVGRRGLPQGLSQRGAPRQGGGVADPAPRHAALAGRLHSDLKYGRIDEILAAGVHTYLSQFLDRVGALGVGISRDFLVPMAA